MPLTQTYGKKYGIVHLDFSSMSISLYFTISNLWKMISGFHLDVHLLHYISLFQTHGKRFLVFI